MRTYPLVISLLEKENLRIEAEYAQLGVAYENLVDEVKALEAERQITKGEAHAHV